MFQPYGILAWVVAFGLTVTLSGCGSPAPQEKPTTPAEGQPQEGQPAERGEHMNHEGHEHDADHEGHGSHGDHAALERNSDAVSPEAVTGLAALSDADRAAVEKQQACPPVSGLVLGTMGKPYKVTAKGETVFLCCPGCEDKIIKDPDTHLAKLKASQLL
jgi:hypothetical protein